MLKGILLTLFAALSISARAELVHADYKNDGDGLVTYDTSTNLSWLKFHADGVTRTTTLNNMGALTAAGGTLEGWRVATYDEVLTLWRGIFGDNVSVVSANSVQFVSEAYGITMAELQMYQEFLGGGNWGTSGYFYSAGSFWQDESKTATGIAGFVASSVGSGHYHAPEVVRTDGNAVYGTVSIMLVKGELLDLGGIGDVNDVPFFGGIFACAFALALTRRRNLLSR